MSVVVIGYWCFLVMFVAISLGASLAMVGFSFLSFLLCLQWGRENGGGVPMARLFPFFFFSWQITTSALVFLMIYFFPFSCTWPSSSSTRSDSFTGGSEHMPVLEALREVGQMMRPPICLHLLVAYGKEAGSVDFHMTENQKHGALMCVRCSSAVGLQDMHCSVDLIYFLKLKLRGVSVILECFFCILKTRVVDSLAEDGGSRSFGSIHRWQVREPLSLIPRSKERESFRLNSVLRLRDLQLNIKLHLVRLPARLPEESLALWRACTKEVSKDFNCGCAPYLSHMDRHKTPVVVFLIFGLDFIVLVFSMCKVALMYTLVSRVL